MRAARTSAMAVAWGTPRPSTPRVVQAWPGPTPTSTPAAPVRIRCRAALLVAQPPTITGMSNWRMNVLRFNGSTMVDTCSADTTVPWMTSMSSSPARMCSSHPVGALRGDRGARHHPGVVDLADPVGNQTGNDRLLVQLLHPLGGLLHGLLGDLGQDGVGVLVTGPEALQVEHAHPAESADLDGGGRADHAVHGRAHEGQFEAVGVDLPGDVDILGVASATAGDDGNVVEPVGPSPALPQSRSQSRPWSLPLLGQRPVGVTVSGLKGLCGGLRKESILVTQHPDANGAKGPAVVPPIVRHSLDPDPHPADDQRRPFENQVVE